jgi:hypothetical protein
MTNLHEIQQLQRELAAYRALLAVLDQRAKLGASYAPPGVYTDMAADRADIARLKAALRDAGVVVEDQAGDTAVPNAQAEPPTVPVRGGRQTTVSGGQVAGDKIAADKRLGDKLDLHQYYLQHRPRIDPAQAQALLEHLPLDAIPDLAPLPSSSRMPLRHNPLFVGRTDDLRALAMELKGGATAITTGIGGVGKTQLVSEFAHCYGQFFLGGVFWLSFADPAGIDGEIAACGGAGALELYNDASGLRQAEQVRHVYAEWAQPIP